MNDVKKFMPDVKYTEVVKELEELNLEEWPDDYARKVVNLADRLKTERHMSHEFQYRWKQVAKLLCQARCPANCNKNTCAWCYERELELSAFKTYNEEDIC